MPSSSQFAKLLRQMDASIRCIVSLGRPSGCGMPGSVAAGPLAALLEAASAYMANEPAWSFVDLGAGAGRMLLAAKLCSVRPHSCAGIELCDLTHTFEACKARLVKKGLLQPAEALTCKLHVGDAMHFSTTAALLGPAAAAGPVMVSLIDEGMPHSVREHMYSCVAHDPNVQVVVTVNYKSRAGLLPSVLTQAGFRLVQEMPAPLMGGKCSTAGRIFVRTQHQHRQQQRRPPQHQQSASLQAQEQQPAGGMQQQAGPALDTQAPRRQRSAARRAAARWKGW